MMRKIGMNRPNKLSLGPKKVAPPTIPGDQSANRISGVFSESGLSDIRDGANSETFNASFESFNSDGVYGMASECLQEMYTHREDCGDSIYGRSSGPSSGSMSSGYSSNIQYEKQDYRNQVLKNGHPEQYHAQRQSEFKEPFNVAYRPHPSTPNSVGSPQDLSPTKGSRNSMSSIDSGWASNPVALSSFCSRNSTSSLNSDKTSFSNEELETRPIVPYQQRRLSTISSGPSSLQQRNAPIRSSLRGSAESVGSRSSQSDLYSSRVPTRQTQYSSSSSLGSSRNGEDSICTLDVRQMMSQGLPDTEIVNCWLSDLRFEEYFSLFASAGYDMPTISRMTPEDLTAIGIKKPHHRKKLKSEIDKLNCPDHLPQQVPQTIEEMMHLLRLDQYIPALRSQGYNSINDILSISIEDLEDIGFYMLGHQKRLLLGIKRVKDIKSGKKISLPEYEPEEVTMSSLPPTLPSKQSFSSFHMPPGQTQQSNQLRFPTHPEQSNFNQSNQSNHQQISYHPEYFKVQRNQKQTSNHLNSYNEILEMPQPMEPLNHQFYETFAGPNPSYPTNLSQNAAFNIQHVQQTHAEIPKSSAPSIWQKFPSYQDTAIKEHTVQVHDHGQNGYGSGTLTRQKPETQIFSNDYPNSGTLPRPTATVKPLKNTINQGDLQSQAMEVTNSDIPVISDEMCSGESIQIDNNMPFANERSGTIRLKTNPSEAFAEFEKEERASQETKETKEDVPMEETNKSLLKTPTRPSNRTAGDVMDDISSMLADLTDELDSMLCSESV
eukprot:TRINITY_DN13905_c0_g1_i1.p1 TRINITY_DN13905_c0_g1~~TRINITY_DN13905_c0_g1_i1.p1  ORF type:complete len:775 (-),score=100.21 TRINITY_DN13905_c0_g1_i1:376-2700(-)